ncbi:MAG TPA: hypothetical protein VHO70_24070 [Chitinispirillaceae bacterium]|nr:hypothetical protein [Chitinispirillaceae bacterium]
MNVKFFLLPLCVVIAAFSQPAAPPDNYEPNNSFQAAYPISVGDSVVKNATVFGTVDFDSNTLVFSPDIDADAYKVTLNNNTLVNMSAFPWLNGTSEDTNTTKWRWRIFVCDTAYHVLFGGRPYLEFKAEYTGVYHVVVTSIRETDYICRYGLSVSEKPYQPGQIIEVPDTAHQEDTSSIHMIQPDTYEPNNSFQTAYPISVGDSVVKNATVSGTVDFESNSLVFSPDIDADAYKIKLTNNTLVNMSAFPWLNGTSEDTNTAKWRWRIFVCDTAYHVLFGGRPFLEFKAEYTGVYHVVVTSIRETDYVCRYGLSISERAVLSEQIIEVSDTGLQEDTSGYHLNASFDTANLSINLTLKENVSGRVNAKILLPGEFKAVNTQGAIKTVKIDADQSIISSIKSANITIPYSQEDIFGYSENSLKVLRLNDTTNQWIPVDYTIDTVKNQIVAHSTNLSIYGIFAGASTPVIHFATPKADVFGVKTMYHPEQQSIAVHITLKNSADIDCRLFTIQGKCVGRYSKFITHGESVLNWNIGTLVSGKYFQVIKAGNHQVKQSIFITR